MRNDLYQINTYSPYSLDSSPTLGSTDQSYDFTQYNNQEQDLGTNVYKLPVMGGDGYSTPDDTSYNGLSGTGSFSKGALDAISNENALGGITSAFGSLGTTAAKSGAMGFGITGNLGVGLTSALGALGNPMGLANAFGSFASQALGINTSPVAQNTIGTLAGLASIANPALGVAVAALGPMAYEGLMDAFDARTHEQVRDLAEQHAPGYAAGRTAGSYISNQLDKSMDLSYTSPYGSMYDALANLGMNIGKNTMQDYVAAEYEARGYSPSLSNTMADIDVSLADVAAATNQDLGVDIGGRDTGYGRGGISSLTGEYDYGYAATMGLADTYADLSLDAPAAAPSTTNTQGLGLGAVGEISGQTQETTEAATVGQETSINETEGPDTTTNTNDTTDETAEESNNGDNTSTGGDGPSGPGNGYGNGMGYSDAYGNEPSGPNGTGGPVGADMGSNAQSDTTDDDDSDSDF